MKRFLVALALVLGGIAAVEIAAPGSIVSQAQAASTYTVVVRHNGETVASNTYDNIEDAISKYHDWKDFYGAGYDVSIEIKDNAGKEKQAE